MEFDCYSIVTRFKWG